MPGPSPLALLVCTPAISPEPRSSNQQQWQPLVLPGPGAGGRCSPPKKGKAPIPGQGQCHLVWGGEGSGSSRWNSPGPGGQETGVLVPAVPFSSCVALSSTFSEPPSAELCNEGDDAASVSCCDGKIQGGYVSYTDICH